MEKPFKTKCVENQVKVFGRTFAEQLLPDFRVLVVSHKNPDGDAIGSALGVSNMLEQSGLRSDVILPDPCPDFLKWLPGYKKVTHFERNPGKVGKLIDDADAVIMVDFNDPDRLGEMKARLMESRSMKFLIDHHPGNGEFAHHKLICVDYGSTAELVYDLFRNLYPVEFFSRELATCLLTGILTDTNGLMVNSSYPAVFRVVSELVGLGADKEEILDRVYNQFSVNRMRLLGYCLNQKMVVIPEMHTAYIWITKDDLKQFGHIKGDTEGFVNYPLSIAGVRFSVLFTEQDDHIKLSLRSKGLFPSNAVASEHFHGGGHLNASGGRSFMPMKETLVHFESILKQYKGLI